MYNGSFEGLSGKPLCLKSQTTSNNLKTQQMSTFVINFCKKCSFYYYFREKIWQFDIFFVILRPICVL